MLPNFLVVGAQKSATSSVCDLLGEHADVFMCEPKEPYFFSHDEVFARGMGWYESLFAGAGEALAVGEGSTTYTQSGLYPRAAERVIAALPEAKIVYVVRDPLERMRSHWMHLRSKGGRETLPFSEAVRARAEYVDHSLYGAQLAPYVAHYGEAGVRVMFFEDFRSDPEREVRGCLSFLGVNPAGWRPGDAGRVRHRSAEGRADTRALRPLRAIPGFERLRDALPSGARGALRRVLKKPVGERPEWTAESRAWAAGRVRADAEAFLDRWGKPRDYWSL